MSHLDDHEQAIVDAWHGAAAPWTRAVREQTIESRRLVTDDAIVRAVLAQAPGRVLDVGCGEGWLAHRLIRAGLHVTGVDAIAELVAAAGAQGGDFRQLSYAQLAEGDLSERFDAVICNFSLLGKTSVDDLLKAMPAMLQPHGVLLIQTLHPLADGGSAYVDGWREGSWAGCGEGFGQAAPWYFRTLAGWQASFAAAGLHISSLAEPLHPRTGRPASIIFGLTSQAKVLA
jgi:2-polyprenyl-3-methyl-5-hydroxy-6-metoxy-1,4-benzoquinol methylase